MPGHNLMLAGWHILDLERAIVLHDREVRARDREEERLHEFMLIALQTIVAVLFGTTTEGHGLIKLVALLRKTDVETGCRSAALHGEAMRVMEHALCGLG